MDKEAVEKIAEILYNTGKTYRGNYNDPSWYQYRDKQESQSYYDVAEEALAELEELGYRKPPEGEPRVLTYEDGHELRRNSEETLVGDTCENSFDYGFEEGARAQRQLDKKHYEGER